MSSRTSTKMFIAAGIAFVPALASAQVDVTGSSGARVHVGPGGDAVITSSSGKTITAAGSRKARHGHTDTRECSGGRLEVAGTGANITVPDVCQAVELSGTRNVVHVRLAPDAEAALTGTGNTLIWTPADPKGIPPRIENTGLNNISRRE